MSGNLSDNGTFHTLNVIYDFNHEALWIEVDTMLPAERVIRVLEMVLFSRSISKQIRMDNESG